MLVAYRSFVLMSCKNRKHPTKIHNGVFTFSIFIKLILHSLKKNTSCRVKNNQKKKKIQKMFGGKYVIIRRKRKQTDNGERGMKRNRRKKASKLVTVPTTFSPHFV